MIVPFRSAILVIAALTASSVAPAQVNPAAEPTARRWLPFQHRWTVDAACLARKLSIRWRPIADEEQSGRTKRSNRAQPWPKPLPSCAAPNAGSRELECLAGAIYFESKSESLPGQLAVGHVIANRAASGRFPSSYCGVVFQRSQFSFVRGRSMPYIPRASQDWKDAVAIAKIVDQELHPSPMGKALFFHARRVSPGWRLTRVGTLGNHVFYR